MPDREKDDFLGDLLAAALARRATVEPRDGLEEHTLAHIRAHARPFPLLRWLAWPALGALAGAVVVAVVLELSPRPETSPPAIARIAPGVESPALPSLVEPAPTASRTNARQASPTAAPRRERFPSPTPLSEQEVLLLRFVREAPPEALATLVTLGHPIEPLKIQILSIPPLIIDELKPVRNEEQGG